MEDGSTPQFHKKIHKKKQVFLVQKKHFLLILLFFLAPFGTFKA